MQWGNKDWVVSFATFGIVLFEESLENRRNHISDGVRGAASPHICFWYRCNRLAHDVNELYREGRCVCLQLHIAMTLLRDGLRD